MKLITKAIEQAFAKQGDTSEMEMSEIKIVMKLFGGGAFSWYLYEKIDEDTYMGYVNLGDPEMSECGYVSLSEIKAVKFPPFGLGVERIAMLRYGINDIRLYFENDFRFFEFGTDKINC